MLRAGHMGLTGGLASAASAIWMRKKILSHLENSSSTSSLRKRIRRRSKWALASIAFTGCATVVSGGLDSIERTFGFGHRTVGHSAPWMSAIYATARAAKESGIEKVQRLCEKVGMPESAEQVLGELDDLASWVLDGSLAGVVTHWAGDVPTSGQGATALRLLEPLLETKTNLDLVLATSPLLNQGALYFGGIFAGVSWLTVGAYLTLSKGSINRVETMVSDFVKWIANKIPGEAWIYERARNFYEWIVSSVRKITSSMATSKPANIPLISHTKRRTAAEVGLQSSSSSNSPKSVGLRSGNKSSKKSVTSSAQAESDFSLNTSGIPLYCQNTT